MERDELIREAFALLGDGATRADAERLVDWHLSHRERGASLPPLGAIAEVAEALGVPRTTASTWLYRGKLDVAPVQTLSVGAIYNLDEVMSRACDHLKPVSGGDER